MKSNAKLLRIDASANVSDSTSRKLGNHYVQLWGQMACNAEIIHRDLSEGLPQLSEEWLHAYFADQSQRTETQRQILQLSDELVEEIKQADEILITTPMYNFTIPSSLKAWIDLICRAGVTFEYTENGPRGLIENKPVKIIISTGGVPVGSPMDYLTDYLKLVLGFVGLTDVTVIAADKMNVNADESYQTAISMIDNQLAPFSEIA